MCQWLCAATSVAVVYVHCLLYAILPHVYTFLGLSGLTQSGKESEKE